MLKTYKYCFDFSTSNTLDTKTKKLTFNNLQSILITRYLKITINNYTKKLVNNCLELNFEGIVLRNFSNFNFVNQIENRKTR